MRRCIHCGSWRVPGPARPCWACAMRTTNFLALAQHVAAQGTWPDKLTRRQAALLAAGGQRAALGPDIPGGVPARRCGCAHRRFRRGAGQSALGHRAAERQGVPCRFRSVHSGCTDQTRGAGQAGAPADRSGDRRGVSGLSGELRTAASRGEPALRTPEGRRVRAADRRKARYVPGVRRTHVAVGRPAGRDRHGGAVVVPCQ